jgi:type IV fimbrial biogenesis protein FimT
MTSASGSGPNRRQLGVTLIELCVVMAIVAILYSQAAPAFSAWVQNAQIRTAAESIQSGLQLARSEAIRRNRSVIFWLTSTANPAAADWLVGCANPSGAGTQPEAIGDCPGTAVSVAGPPAVDGVNFNWIQRQAASDQQTANAQVLMPNGATWVTFSSLGLVIPNADGSVSINEIDVSNPLVPSALARPLHVLVSGGQVRMCDPALSLASDPRGCT